MKELDKQNPFNLKYDPNNYRIEENSEEEDDNKQNWGEKADKNHSFKNNNNNPKSKPSKVYFYCPYNQTYTKFQNYDINIICKLIKKYQLENYFIIQIDNDNILYEEILKMQFKNESQIIHKMFDLKLDYSFSPFQDSLFFNMSILTDFFYDQIEKYLIQIFFHNHGIYIINKDSCEDIHQILMEKFIFYFVNNSEFFQKSINDKNNKNKSTKILINDFKLKNIIQKFQEVEAEKTHKKTCSISKNIGNINNKGQRKNVSLRQQNNKSHNINTNKNNSEIINLTSHKFKPISKQDKNTFSQEKNKIIAENESLINLDNETNTNKKIDEKCKYSKDMSFTVNSKNLKNLGLLNKNLNDCEEEPIVKNSYISSIGKNKNLIESLKIKYDENDKKDYKPPNKVMKNSDNEPIINKSSCENILETGIVDKKNNNIMNILKLNPQNGQDFNKCSQPMKKKFQLSLQENFSSGEVEMLRLDSNQNSKDKYWDENNKNNLDIHIEKINKEMMGISRSSSMSSYINEKEKEDKVESSYYNNNEMKKYKEKKLNLNLNKKRDSRKRKRENTTSLDKKEERESSPSKKPNEEKKDKSQLETIILKSLDDNVNIKKNFQFDDNKNDDIHKYYFKNEKYFKEHQLKNEDSSTKSKSVDNNNNSNRKFLKSITSNPNDKNLNNSIFRNFSDKYKSNFNLICNFKENEEIFQLVKLNKNNKSHFNLENYSEELMDLKSKINDLSTNNENVLNFERNKENNKKNKNYNNVYNNKIPNMINSSYNPEDYKKFSNFYQENETISSPYIKEKKDSEENRLLSSARENNCSKICENVIEIIADDYNIKEENQNNESYFIRNMTKKNSQKSNHNKRINFSTDELIYYLFVFSLEKLEEFTESLIKETDSLKGIYLELSEKERKDFFRRIHSMEVSMHIIFQETKIKKKFFKFAKNQFRTYNKLSNDFYFKNNFNFFLELMISKITQIELTFETLENFLKMIKENYLIIIEDNTEKENVKLNYVMKVLTILTTIYAPMNIVPGLFGMNVKVPWVGTEVNSTNPFILICVFLIILIIAQLFAFRKLKWF